MESMQPKTKAEFQKSGEAAIRMASICERNQSLYDLSQRLYKVAMEHLSAAHGTDKDDSAQELYLLPHAVRRQLVLAPEEVKNQSIKVRELIPLELDFAAAIRVHCDNM